MSPKALAASAKQIHQFKFVFLNRRNRVDFIRWRPLSYRDSTGLPDWSCFSFIMQSRVISRLQRNIMTGSAITKRDVFVCKQRRIREPTLIDLRTRTTY